MGGWETAIKLRCSGVCAGSRYSSGQGSGCTRRHDLQRCSQYSECGAGCRHNEPGTATDKQRRKTGCGKARQAGGRSAALLAVRSGCGAGCRQYEPETGCSQCVFETEPTRLPSVKLPRSRQPLSSSSRGSSSLSGHSAHLRAPLRRRGGARLLCRLCRQGVLTCRGPCELGASGEQAN